MTPPVIKSGASDEKQAVRIVENLYPDRTDDGKKQSHSFGLQQAIEAYDRHEAIIDHATHSVAFYPK